MELYIEELEVVNSLDAGDDFIKGFERGVDTGLKILEAVISIGGLFT